VAVGNFHPIVLTACVAAVGVGGSAIRGPCPVHARCVYWGDNVDLRTYSTVKCMHFQAVKGIAIAYIALRPLAGSPVSLS